MHVKPGRRAALLVVLLLVLASCSDDDAVADTAATASSTTTAASSATTSGPSAGDVLAPEVRDFCTVDEATDANLWDNIFEAGLGAGVDMDTINAHAGAWRQEYEEGGMSSEEAIAAVGQRLFDLPEYVEACQAAYELFKG